MTNNTDILKGNFILKLKHYGLELTDDQLKRNDEIDNTVYDCICTLVEKQIDWNMEIIADVTDSIEETLKKHDLIIRHPCIIYNEDGSEEYGE